MTEKIGRQQAKLMFDRLPAIAGTQSANHRFHTRIKDVQANRQFDRVHHAGKVEAGLCEQQITPAAGAEIGQFGKVCAMPDILAQAPEKARAGAPALSRRAQLAWIIADGHEAGISE
jgi:hypothetical protein